MKNNGYIVLIMVILLGTVSALTALSLLTIANISSTDDSIVIAQYRAKNYANACAEVALLRIKETPAYTGNETLSFDAGTCEILPLVVVGNNYSIYSVSSSGNSMSKLAVTATLTIETIGEEGEEVEVNHLNVGSYKYVTEFD